MVKGLQWYALRKEQRILRYCTFMVGGRRNHQGRTDKCRCLINEKIPTLLMEWGISVLGGSDEY